MFMLHVMGWRPREAQKEAIQDSGSLRPQAEAKTRLQHPEEEEARHRAWHVLLHCGRLWDGKEAVMSLRCSKCSGIPGYPEYPEYPEIRISRISGISGFPDIRIFGISGISGYMEYLEYPEIRMSGISGISGISCSKLLSDYWAFHLTTGLSTDHAD